jgi:hypothetical protein
MMSFNSSGVAGLDDLQVSMPLHSVGVPGGLPTPDVRRQPGRHIDDRCAPMASPHWNNSRLGRPRHKDKLPLLFVAID